MKLVRVFYFTIETDYALDREEVNIMALTPSEYEEAVGTVQTPVDGVKYVQWGKVVTVNIDKSITMNGSTWILICSGLPRPQIEVFGVAKQNAVDKIIAIDLKGNGNLSVMGSGNSSVLVRGSVTYITRD